MLVIPDVHGREFWKSAPEKDSDLIFLGDYLDPYPHEEITPEKAIEVFKDILALPEDVTLLLGNHDFMYLHDIFRNESCRHSWEHDKEITSLFMDNLSRFKVAEIRGDIVFSHAGFHPGWIARQCSKFGETIPEIVEYLNSHFMEVPVLQALSEYSYYRGGWLISSGSPVWSDVREWTEVKDQDYFQIFGHTQLKGRVIIQTPRWACIDNKCINKVDDNNQITIL